MGNSTRDEAPPASTRFSTPNRSIAAPSPSKPPPPPSSMAAPGSSKSATNHHWSRAHLRIRRASSPASAAKPESLLIINDRADFAMLLNAGLHLGQDDLSPRDARRLTGPDIRNRVFQPQRESTLRRRRRTRRLRRARPHLPHRVQTQPRPRHRRRGNPPLPSPHRKAPRRHRRHHAGECRSTSCAPAPTPSP